MWYTFFVVFTLKLSRLTRRGGTVFGFVTSVQTVNGEVALPLLRDTLESIVTLELIRGAVQRFLQRVPGLRDDVTDHQKQKESAQGEPRPRYS